jgi:hypothetical protein
VDFNSGPNSNWLGLARIPTTFTDGTSNTILFTEKYAKCNQATGPTWNGNHWNDGWGCDTTAFSLSYILGYSLGNPFFACDYAFGNSPAPNPEAIGPASRFQVAPIPVGGTCDPALAQAPRAGGILALLGDASVRLVSSGVSGTTWWAACTPANGEVLGSDW